MRRNESSFVLKFMTRKFCLSSVKIKVGGSSVRISSSDLSNCLVVCLKKVPLVVGVTLRLPAVWMETWF